MIFSLKTRFDIGQQVYHKTPESDLGLILSIRVYHDSDIQYLVTFGPGIEHWLFEEELGETKVFI